MQNLKDVLSETKDSARNTLPTRASCGEEDTSSNNLLSGVNFIHGDIFDVVSTVRLVILLCIHTNIMFSKT